MWINFAFKIRFLKDDELQLHKLDNFHLCVLDLVSATFVLVENREWCESKQRSFMVYSEASKKMNN